MSISVVAIDPDVWRMAKHDYHCMFAIQKLWNTPSYALALDNNEVETEYVDLMLAETPIELKKILQDIFNQRERSGRVRTIESVITPELQAEIVRNQCTDPVEPALIGMAANPASSIILWLVGMDGERSRGLHNMHTKVRFRSFFRNILHKGFSVQMASEIALPGRREDIAAYQSRELENQIRAIFMDRIRSKFGVAPQSVRVTPGEVFNYQDSSGRRGGEVDVYLYLQYRNIRYVWIAECELREEGNEGQPTAIEKIDKLKRKVKAVTAFECAQNNGNTNIHVKGYLVTNASNPHDSTRETIEDWALQFISVIMPKGWATNFHWILRDQDIGDCDL